MPARSSARASTRRRGLPVVATKCENVPMAAKKTPTTAKSTAPEPKGAVRFDATLEPTSVGRAILRLPATASKQLPSRGQVAVQALVGGHAFQTVIEPDGDFGHWMSLSSELQAATGLGPGDTASVELSPSSAWPEPEVPKDLKEALSGAPAEVRELWTTITPMARWEWVRWVNETKVAATRQRRVEVSISKLSDGKRRPCCFNLAACTDPDLAKSGKLAVR